MNASTQSEISALAESSSLALVTLDPVRYVAEVYAPFRVKLAAAKIVSDAIIVDCSTPAGSTIAIEQRAIFRDGVRLAVGKARTERKAPILMICKLIDSEAARIVEEAAPYEAKYDDAIKLHAAKVEFARAQKIATELARVGAIRADIQMIRDLVPKVAGKPSQVIASAIEFLRTIKMTEGRFEEFAAVAIQAVAATGDMLGKKYDDMLASETAEQARIADAARAAAEHAAAVAQLAADRAELAEQKRLAKIEADRVAAATKAQLDAQQAQIARDRREQEAIVQAARDVQAAEVAKFQAEQAAHAAREVQFLHEKEAHAAEVKLAADALAMQIKRDADHIEALPMDLQFDIDIAEAATLLAGVITDDYFDLDFIEVATIPPTLRLGQIGARLGFVLTADFLCTLGFEPSARDKAACLYHEHEFSDICAALVRHIDVVRAGAS